VCSSDLALSQQGSARHLRLLDALRLPVSSLCRAAAPATTLASRLQPFAWRTKLHSLAPLRSLQGGCPGDNNGIEAGFTFSLGGRPSAVALPEQVRAEAARSLQEVTCRCCHVAVLAVTMLCCAAQQPLRSSWGARGQVAGRPGRAAQSGLLALQPGFVMLVAILTVLYSPHCRCSTQGSLRTAPLASAGSRPRRTPTAPPH